MHVGFKDILNIGKMQAAPVDDDARVTSLLTFTVGGVWERAEMITVPQGEVDSEKMPVLQVRRASILKSKVSGTVVGAELPARSTKRRRPGRIR